MPKLSGDTTGFYAPIKLVAADISSAPREIHSVPDGETHSVWLDLINRSSGAVVVTVLKGGTTDPDHAEKVEVAPYKRRRVLDGQRVAGAGGTAGKIKCYIASGDADKISVDGHYNLVS